MGQTPFQPEINFEISEISSFAPLTFRRNGRRLEAEWGEVRAESPFDRDPMEGCVDVTAMLRPAVYLLWRQGRVVYVGQSKCPLVRIYTHRSLARQKRVPWIKTRGIVFDKVQVIPTIMDALDEVEQVWIRHYQPVHNIHHNPEGGEERAVPLAIILNLPKRPPFERRI